MKTRMLSVICRLPAVSFPFPFCITRTTIADGLEHAEAEQDAAASSTPLRARRSRGRSTNWERRRHRPWSLAAPRGVGGGL
nr:unnamed protein product [Digitaria exilis]